MFGLFNALGGALHGGGAMGRVLPEGEPASQFSPLGFFGGLLGQTAMGRPFMNAMSAGQSSSAFSDPMQQFIGGDPRSATLGAMQPPAPGAAQPPAPGGAGGQNPFLDQLARGLIDSRNGGKSLRVPINSFF